MGYPLWVYKLLGRSVVNKLELQEGPLQDSKKWYQSKTVWSDIVTILVASYMAAKPVLVGYGIVIPEATEATVLAILGGMGLYGRATAEKKIG